MGDTEDVRVEIARANVEKAKELLEEAELAKEIVQGDTAPGEAKNTVAVSEVRLVPPEKIDGFSFFPNIVNSILLGKPRELASLVHPLSYFISFYPFPPRALVQREGTERAHFTRCIYCVRPRGLPQFKVGYTREVNARVGHDFNTVLPLGVDYIWMVSMKRFTASIEDYGYNPFRLVEMFAHHYLYKVLQWVPLRSGALTGGFSEWWLARDGLHYNLEPVTYYTEKLAETLRKTAMVASLVPPSANRLAMIARNAIDDSYTTLKTYFREAGPSEDFGDLFREYDDFIRYIKFSSEDAFLSSHWVKLIHYYIRAPKKEKTITLPEIRNLFLERLPEIVLKWAEGWDEEQTRSFGEDAGSFFTSIVNTLPKMIMDILLPVSTVDNTVPLPPHLYTWHPTPHFFRLPGSCGFYAREVLLQDGVDPIATILPAFNDFLLELHTKGLSTEEDEREEGIPVSNAIAIAKQTSKEREKNNRNKAHHSFSVQDGKAEAKEREEEERKERMKEIEEEEERVEGGNKMGKRNRKKKVIFDNS